MSESKEPQDGRSKEAAGPGVSAADGRMPYEAPKIVKKRSVARATLFTATGPTMTGLTMMG